MVHAPSKAASPIDPAIWADFLDLRILLAHKWVSRPGTVNTFSAWKWCGMPGCLHMIAGYGVSQETGSQALMSGMRSSRNSSCLTRFFYLMSSQLLQASTLHRPAAAMLPAHIHPLGKPFYGLVAIVQVCWSQEIWDVMQCTFCNLHFCWNTGKSTAQSHSAWWLCKESKGQGCRSWLLWPEGSDSHSATAQ